VIGWITLGVVVAAVLGTATYFILRWKRPVVLKTEHYQEKWKELQKLLRNKDRWDVALIEADNLLDSALKKKRIRGGSMGERLVKAQRLFTDNDGTWFAHKLRKQVEAEPEFKLKEKDLKEALIALRQALKDLGALKK
jgi:hypothetical protein